MTEDFLRSRLRYAGGTTNIDTLQRIIAYIDARPVPPDLSGALSAALSGRHEAEMLPIEAAAPELHARLLELLGRPEVIGIIPGPAYSKACIGYCSELSREAASTGAVNAIARRPRGVLHGHNTAPAAFVACTAHFKTRRVRSALVLGAGMTARVALTGLRELSCARFMVGFRHQRRISEISGLFRDIRRQLSYFPLSEMKHFFDWAESTGLFNQGKPMPPPDDEFPPDDNGKDSLKRWDMLVNATALGEDSEDQELVTSLNFLRCFNRVFDMQVAPEKTALQICAESAGVPVIAGAAYHAAQLDELAQFWQREIRLHHSGEPQSGDEETPRRRMEIRRQNRG